MSSCSACDYLERPPSYSEFLQHYLLTNKPVVIGPALVTSWPAITLWTVQGGINWDYLSSQFGGQSVTVADCSTREFSDQRRETMNFCDVVDLWRSRKGGSLYVKDWHLARAVHPETFYSTPDIFRDDWMNAYHSACTSDDFRFVYVGAAGTFTPLHRDVYTSYSWSTNVCGRKRWWLYPPGQTRFLLRKGMESHLETAFDVRDVDMDTAVFPDFHKAKPIVVDQNDGETIFVGWYHQVENLTACISINHNWCNAVNLRSLYDSMCAKVTEVERALDDVRDLLSSNAHSKAGVRWEEQWVQIVQDLVEKDAGWNWMTFWKMVRHVLDGRTDLATDSQNSGQLWQPARPVLRPSMDFVVKCILTCYERFVARDEREVDLVDGLHYVLEEIKKLTGNVMVPLPEACVDDLDPTDPTANAQAR